MLIFPDRGSMPTMSPETRRRLSLLARVSVTAIALGWVLTQVDPAQALAQIRTLPLWIFVVPFLAVMLNALLHGARLSLLMGLAGVEMGVITGLGVALRASFIGLVLPTGGAEVAKVALMTRATGRADAAVAVAVATRLLEFIPWSMLLFWAVVRGLGQESPPLAWTALGMGMAFFGAVCAGAILARLRLVLPGEGRVARFLNNAAAALRRVGGRPGGLALVTLLAVPFGFLNVFSMWIVLYAFDTGISYPDALMLIPAADVWVSLPITISGVGVREGVVSYVLGLRGIDPSVAVSAALVRWFGELMRAAVGGVWFVLENDRER